MNGGRTVLQVNLFLLILSGDPTFLFVDRLLLIAVSRTARNDADTSLYFANARSVKPQTG